MQVFEHMISQEFRSVPEKLQCLGSKKFTLLPSTAFLCTLDSTPRSAMEMGLRLGTADFSQFNVLTKKISTILSVMKALKSRCKKTVDSVEDVDYDD